MSRPLSAVSVDICGCGQDWVGVGGTCVFVSLNRELLIAGAATLQVYFFLRCLSIKGVQQHIAETMPRTQTNVQQYESTTIQVIIQMTRNTQCDHSG